jgi:hypothetical protein
MSLPTGLDLNTIMATAANNVSSTLEGRRTRSEQKADLFELKDRELDDEEELFRRKNRREQETKTKEYIATINAYFSPEQASEIIARAGGYNGLNIAATRIASLENNGHSSNAVYNINKDLTNPNVTDTNMLPLGSLFTRPPKKDSEDKFPHFQALLTDVTNRIGRETDPKIIKELERQKAIIEENFQDYQKIANPINEAEGEYISNFSKQSPSSTVFGEFENIMKSFHNIDKSNSEKITQWKEGNKVLVMDQMTKFSKRLDKNLESYTKNGMKVENEPAYMASKNNFQAMTRNFLTTYLSKEYKNFANNKPSKLKPNDNGEVVALTTTQIQTNLDNGMYNEGDIVPVVIDKRNGNWIYSGYNKFGQNIISLAPKKDN